jgi:hypothetical protein
MLYEKGDIWLVQYPYKGKREQAGMPPARYTNAYRR